MGAITWGYKRPFYQGGGKRLAYEWKVVPATAYIEFERSGNRRIMEDPFVQNNQAIADLFMAELAEGNDVSQPFGAKYKATEVKFNPARRQFSNVWGKEIYRVSLNAEKVTPSGTYTYTIHKIK